MILAFWGDPLLEKKNMPLFYFGGVGLQPSVLRISSWFCDQGLLVVLKLGIMCGTGDDLHARQVPYPRTISLDPDPFFGSFMTMIKMTSRRNCHPGEILLYQAIIYGVDHE